MVMTLMVLALLGVDPVMETAIDIKVSQVAAKYEAKDMNNEARREAIRGDVLKWFDRPVSPDEEACVLKHAKKFDKFPSRQESVKGAMPQKAWHRVLLDGKVWKVWGIQDPVTKMVSITEDAEHKSELEK